VSETQQKSDYWRWPALLLWLIFFTVGIVPERIFLVLRDIADISTYDAALNSYQLITLALAAYFGFFCYQRCHDAGLDAPIAQAKAIQVAALGLLAFLDVPFEQLLEGRNPYYHFLLGISAAKMLTWLYLYSIMVRYYVARKRNVFAHMVTLIPSAQALDTKAEAPLAPSNTAESSNENESNVHAADKISARDEAM
jgi:hypothetical protein